VTSAWKAAVLFAFNPVPEPSTWAMLDAGMMTLFHPSFRTQRIKTHKINLTQDNFHKDN